MAPAIAGARRLALVDPAHFEVAGVRLGGTVAQARSGLAEAGYRIEREDLAPSFADEVQAEAARRRDGRASWPDNTSTAMLVAEGSGGEHVEVTFGQVTGGAVVVAVFLKLPQTSSDKAAFHRRFSDLYGRPSGFEPNGGSYFWCSAPVSAACGSRSAAAYSEAAALPMLTASPFHGGSLRLEAGADAERRLSRMFEEAVLAAVAAPAPTR